MATDTARINLELASGRNEVTAPFHSIAQRRRLHLAQPVAAEVTEPPTKAPVFVDVPLGMDEAPDAPPLKPEISVEPSAARPTWIAFIGATVAVATVVWWVMSQRMPDIDPWEVVQRNLDDARGAMAEGRYTDPPERSAFHYYNTVLALDPKNADALAGIDAIADRHLTNARVMLAEQRVAEAAVAIDRARRVRPQHNSLPALDTQLRAELRRILTTANAAVRVEPAKAKVAKASTTVVPQPSKPLLTPKQAAAPSPTPTAPESELTSTPSSTRVAKVPPLLSFAPDVAQQSTPSLITPAPADVNESGSAPVIDEPVNALPEIAPAPAPVPSVTPKLIKMVQPEYPQEALMRGFEGWVDVSLAVNAAGDVVAPKIEGSSRGRLFNRAALNAIQQWKYEPRDGDTSERLRVRLQFRHSK